MIGHDELVLVGRDRAAELLHDALASSGADGTEIAMAARTSSVLRFAGGRVHQPQDLAFLQFTVRAVVGDHAARVAITSPSLLGDAVARACATAVALASSSGDGGGAPHPAASATQPPTVPRQEAAPGRRRAARTAGPAADPGLWSDHTAAWDAGRRAVDIAALHRQAGPLNVGLAGTLAAGTTELAVATSRGLDRYAVATEASFSLTAQRGDGTSHAEEVTRDAAGIDVAGIGVALVADALRMVGAEELPAGTWDVVLGPLATAELIAFLPSLGFTAPALAAGIGVVAARTRTFSPLVTVADDATATDGLPFPFDFEGVTKQRVELIRAGRLGGVLSDLASASVTGGSTGHAHVAREEAPAARAANLRLEAGTSSVDELVAGVSDGVYIQRLWYTRLVDASSGLITGTTRDAAFRIRDGRLGGPVKGTRFTESVMDALARVDGVGDRITHQPVLNVWNGAAGAPAVRVRGFRLGVAERTRPTNRRDRP